MWAEEHKRDRGYVEENEETNDESVPSTTAVTKGYIHGTTLTPTSKP